MGKVRWGRGKSKRVLDVSPGVHQSSNIIRTALLSQESGGQCPDGKKRLRVDARRSTAGFQSAG